MLMQVPLTGRHQSSFHNELVLLELHCSRSSSLLVNTVQGDFKDVDGGGLFLSHYFVLSIAGPMRDFSPISPSLSCEALIKSKLVRCPG